MSEHTAIEWCDSTFNPWIGCTRVGPACDHCYAAVSTPARTMGIEWGPHAERRRTSDANWKQPLRWEREHEAFAEQHGRRRRVFCASLADVFDNAVPQQWRDDLFELIRVTPHLDWLLLTKRIGNVGNMLPVPFDFERIYPNVWLGITICNQAEGDRDVPKLLELDARVRFLSVEPMLGPITFEGMFSSACDMRDGTNALEALSWVICGGESGPHARPMHPDWARSLRDQCSAAGVPFLFKQWGNWRAAAWFDGPDADAGDGDDFVDLDRTDHLFVAIDGRTWDTEGGRLMYPPLPLGHWCLMVDEGKRAAGRLLDGVRHDAWPEVRP